MEWTEDLSVRVAHGETLATLVDFILACQQDGRPWPVLRDVLTERFGLPYDDARLAVDRVEGGQVRAETTDPANELDRAKDPIAWISYQRARGTPFDEPVGADRTAKVEAAKAHLSSALEAGELTGVEDVGVALALTDLASELSAPDAPGTTGHQLKVALLAATTISKTAEAIIETLGSEPCAPEGSQAWVDAVSLAAASARLADLFRALGRLDLELRGLDLQGRIVTRMLGQCHAHVGRAMLASAHCALRIGDLLRAADLYHSVVEDFAALVTEWEATAEVPFDEHRLALEHLGAALDMLAELHGDALEPESAQLRTRCAAVLSRQ